MPVGSAFLGSDASCWLIAPPLGIGRSLPLEAR